MSTETKLDAPFIEDLYTLARLEPPARSPGQAALPSPAPGSAPDSPVVIVGSLRDDHVRAVYQGVCARGHEPFVLDPHRCPAEFATSLGSAPRDIVIDGWCLSRPAAVYIRSLHRCPLTFGSEIESAMRENWRGTLVELRQRSAMVSAALLRWEMLGTAFYNPITVINNVVKPYQLACLQAAGLPVPDTLWSNDPEAVRRFCSEHEAIYKPVAGGAPTRKVQPHDLEPERLAKLPASAVCFQELMPGDDVRVYVIDDRVVCAMRIHTDTIDFRLNVKGIEAIELPDEVKVWCIRAAEVLGLRYTGMDIKGDRDGNYRILELNSSPMFLGFEAQAGVEIGGPLCDALVSHIPA